MTNAEVELKFPIDDLDRLESRLPALGFHLDTPRTFEQNTLYDTPSRTLRTSRQILRLRRYGDTWTVTHKRPYASSDTGSNTPRYKVRIETETSVDDGPALGLIFEQLGFTPVFRYEKFRTIWTQPAPPTPANLGAPYLDPEMWDTKLPIAADPPPCTSCHLVIDETPIGNYAELEGPPAWIDRTLITLGVSPAACITESYGRLFLAWKERTSSPADHLTFDQIPSPEPLHPALS